MTAQAGQISPFLWFTGTAVEAAEFYVSLLPNSRIINIAELPAGPAGGGALVEFELNGLKFGAMDGPQMFEMTPAVSFVIPCDSQEEIDRYWNALSEAGTEGFAGWVTDRFGVSWQVVPAAMPELMGDDPAAVTQTMMTMKKIDIEQLRQAGLSAK